MPEKFYYLARQADGENPAGLTVSKNDELPEGDFKLTEYCWGWGEASVSLWFVDADDFSEDERQLAFQMFLTIVNEETDDG